MFHEKIAYNRDISGVREKIGGVLTARMGQLGKRGRTAMLDALAEAVRSLRMPQLGDSMLLITDAGENHSRTGTGELEAMLTTRGIRLFAIVLREYGGRAGAGDDDGMNTLEYISRHSGGLTHIVRKERLQFLDEVAASVRGIARLITQAYALELAFDVQPVKRTELSLKFSPEFRKKWKYMNVIYPRWIMPCGK